MNILQQFCAFGTFINMRVNVKGLISRIDAAVSVKLLTHRQRSVLAVNPLIRKVTHRQVLEIDVLKRNMERRVKPPRNPHVMQQKTAV